MNHKIIKHELINSKQRTVGGDITFYLTKRRSARSCWGRVRWCRWVRRATSPAPRGTVRWLCRRVRSSARRRWAPCTGTWLELCLQKRNFQQKLAAIQVFTHRWQFRAGWFCSMTVGCFCHSFVLQLGFLRMSLGTIRLDGADLCSKIFFSWFFCNYQI